MYKKLENILKDKDGVLITSPHNLRYFCNFSGGEGVALITENVRLLFVDSRYTVAAKQEAKDFSVIEFGGGKLFEMLNQKINEYSLKTLAFEDTEMTVASYNSYKQKIDADFSELGDKLNCLRMVKTADEISYLKKAESIGDEVFSKILPYIKAGVCENDIALEIEYQMRKMGAEGTSFETIVVSGKKSSMPHGKPDNKKLESGDFVTMDFGCKYNGYCSDMTRTVAIEKVSDEQKKIYDIVLKAQRIGLEAIRAGVLGKDADRAARNVIEEAGYGKYFGHSLGHGVGLLIHEKPNLSPMSETILAENMVVTCEPGIYIEDFCGVRIEDMVVVKNDGYENLTQSPKELIICG